MGDGEFESEDPCDPREMINEIWGEYTEAKKYAVDPAWNQTADSVGRRKQ